jgi:hypothetical protein
MARDLIMVIITCLGMKTVMVSTPTPLATTTTRTRIFRDNFYCNLCLSRMHNGVFRQFKVGFWVMACCLLAAGGCRVKGPIVWHQHRHAPHRFTIFKYWAHPFGYPYGANGHTPLFYKAPKAGRRRDRKRHWPKSFVPHPAYYRVHYHSRY